MFRTAALRTHAGLFGVSAASLLFELALTRVYAVAQGHHFAFMAIATALLGIGASGTLMARSQRLRAASPSAVIALGGIGFAAAALAAYVTADRIPFDPYRVGVEAGQLAWLMLYFLIAGVPFIFAGLAVVAPIAADPATARTPYFVSLAGSAVGAAVSLPMLATAGSAGTVLVASGLAALAAAVAARRRPVQFAGILGAAGLALTAALIAPAGPRMSTYAGLSQLLRHPGAELAETRLSPTTQVDLVRGAALRSAQGLSLAYDGEVPLPRYALTVDGANAAPLDIRPGDYLERTPLALAAGLRPAANALILDSVGAFEVATLLQNTAAQIEVVQPDRAVAKFWETRRDGTPFASPRVEIRVTGVRPALRRARGADLVVWPLRESFQGVAAGTFSIRESFEYTEDAMREAWRALGPKGMLVITRWLQATPAEPLRAWASLVKAVRAEEGGQTERHLLAWRSIEVVTMVASRSPFSPAEIADLESALQANRFDWVFAAELAREDANRFNVLPDSSLYDAFAAVAAGERAPAGGFDLEPVGDDRPYFFHYFRWTQARTVLSALGKFWQPYGGAGFLILVPLAAGATLLALAAIVGPLLGTGGIEPGRRAAGRMGFFALVGAGYVFVQIALLQRMILLVDAPTTAFAVGLAAMLGWTGAGSMAFGRLSGRTAWHATVALALIGLTAAGLRALTPAALALPLGVRILIGVAAIAPVGLALGSILPAAVRALEGLGNAAVPWAWAANGVASVAGALLATMALVTFGFAATMATGTAMYGLAAVLWLTSRPHPLHRVR